VLTGPSCKAQEIEPLSFRLYPAEAIRRTFGFSPLWILGISCESEAGGCRGGSKGLSRVKVSLSLHPRPFHKQKKAQAIHWRFILVGDSAEQDLELYVDLARLYPSSVRAIFIRDVTTPDLLSFGSQHAAGGASSPRGPMQRMASAPREESSGRTSRPPLGLRSLSSTGLSAARWATPGQQRPSNKPAKAHTLPPPPPPPPPSSSSSSPQRYLHEPCSDALSLNNPLSGPSGAVPETRRKLVETFYARVAEAERVLPDHVVLRLFKNGEECVEESVKMVRGATGTGKRGTDPPM
jgi:hypothetical protein